MFWVYFWIYIGVMIFLYYPFFKLIKEDLEYGENGFMDYIGYGFMALIPALIWPLIVLFFIAYRLSKAIWERLPKKED